jgi:hypothetical protein
MEPSLCRHHSPNKRSRIVSDPLLAPGHLSLFETLPLETTKIIASAVRLNAKTSEDTSRTPKIVIAQLRLVCRTFARLKHSHASLADFKIVEKTGPFLLLITMYKWSDVSPIPFEPDVVHKASVDITPAIGGVYSQSVYSCCDDIRNRLCESGFTQLRVIYDMHTDLLALENDYTELAVSVILDANTSHALGFSNIHTIQSNFLYPGEVWDGVTCINPICLQSRYIINPVAVETLGCGDHLSGRSVHIPRLPELLLFDIGYNSTPKNAQDWGGHALPPNWDTQQSLKLLLAHLTTSGETIPLNRLLDLLMECNSVRFAQFADLGYLEDDGSGVLKFFDTPIYTSLPFYLDCLPRYRRPDSLRVCATNTHIANIGWNSLRMGWTIPSNAFAAMIESVDYNDLASLKGADFKKVMASSASQKKAFLVILESQNGIDIELARIWQMYWFPSATTVDDLANLLGVMGGTHREITLRVLIRKLLLIDNNTDGAGSVE